VYANDPESCASGGDATSGSIAAGRASHAGQVKG
jgi:hypothetical protein